MRTVTTGTLGRLTDDQFGSGVDSSSDPGDDRTGRYWKVVDPVIPLAVRIALITGRPLLLEGPSGAGKSSLARALAETLGWTYYETVVNSRTELDSLVGTVDHVRRLHEAELAARTTSMFDGDAARFLQPGVLWWAFAPDSAADVAGSARNPGVEALRPNAEQSGAVLLVDEIDKADPDLPNNLLVPFGSMSLAVEARAEPVRASRPVLLCVTSNQERDLPPAFLRRCVALKLSFPNADQLVEIAVRHVAGSDVMAVAQVVRRRFLGDGDGSMSAAEFVDAVRAAVGLGLPADGSGAEWERVEALFRATHERRKW